MFIVEEPVKNSPSGGFQIAQEVISYTHGITKECHQKGRFKVMNADYFTFMIISVLHGICALFCRDRTMSFENKTKEDLMDNGYECFVSLLEKS